MSRNWLCTYNNPPDISLCEAYLEVWSKAPKVTYVTGQLEKGKEGTVHIQYFVNFSDKVRLAHLRKICKFSHFEIVKVNNGADEYCNKIDTRVEGPWTFGVRPARRNKKGDLKRRNEELLEMGAEKAVVEGLIDITKYKQVKQSIDAYRIATTKPYEHNTLRGTWIWGPPGVGKSRYARDNYQDVWLKPQNKWFDGYTGQQTILLDDHDNPCLGHYLKIWMDHYSCTGEVKGGTVPLLHRDFVVTSNYPPEKLYEKDGEEMVAAIRRRCKVIHMEAPFKKQETEELVDELSEPKQI